MINFRNLNGAADGSAELVLFERLSGDAASVGEEIIGIQFFVA